MIVPAMAYRCRVAESWHGGAVENRIRPQGRARPFANAVGRQTRVGFGAEVRLFAPAHRGVWLPRGRGRQRRRVAVGGSGARGAAAVQRRSLGADGTNRGVSAPALAQLTEWDGKIFANSPQCWGDTRGRDSAIFAAFEFLSLSRAPGDCWTVTFRSGTRPDVCRAPKIEVNKWIPEQGTRPCRAHRRRGPGGRDV